MFNDEDDQPVDGDNPAGDGNPESPAGAGAGDEITRLKKENTALATENATLKARKKDANGDVRKPDVRTKPEPDAVDMTEKLVDIKLHIRDKYIANPELKKFDRLIVAGARDLIFSGEESDPIKAIDRVVETLEPVSKPKQPEEESAGESGIPAGAKGGTTPAPKPKQPPPEEPEPTNDDFLNMRENKRLGRTKAPQT